MGTASWRAGLGVSALVVLVLGNCSFQAGGLVPDAGLVSNGTGAAAAAGASGDASRAAPTPDAPLPADDAATTDAASTADTLVQPDVLPASDGPIDLVGSWPAMCRGIKQAHPEAPDGVYRLDDRSREVYCDMTTDGGGWTLVGRSVQGAPAGPFGWSQAAGSVYDDGMPYSLGPDSYWPPPYQILVARYTTGKNPGPVGYRVLLGPPMDSEVCEICPCPVAGPVTVLGQCSPPGWPTFLRYLGFPELQGHFWIGSAPVCDIDADLTLGMFPDGFRLGGTDCESSGELGGEQGMIFVR